jgi:hypothetical protein
MQDRRVAVSMMSILLAVSAYANPFLDTPNDTPVFQFLVWRNGTRGLLGSNRLVKNEEPAKPAQGNASFQSSR